MKAEHTRLFPVLLLAALSALRAAAAPVARDGPVTAEILVAAHAIEPGRPVEVGIRLSMEPGWHVYWKNPGDAGLPTAVEWDLPEGFAAGPLRWPAPLQFREQGLTTYGYEGDVLLVAEITPAVGTAAGLRTLSARVQWLACKVECVPGSASVSIGLPVRPGSPAVNRRVQALFRDAAGRVPAADSSVAASAVAKDGQLILQVDGLGAAPGDAGFFPDEQGVIDGSGTTEAAFADGVLTLRLARPEKQGAPPARLRGVLVVGTGSSARAVALDVPVAEDRAPVPAPAAPTLAALLAALALAFLGGLLLNLMPCVLPVLSLKVLGLVRHAQGDRRTAVAHGMLFSAGVIVSFWVIAGLLIGLRAGGQLLGWGFQFQSPGIVTASALLFFLVGLNLLGVFEIGTRAAAAGSWLEGREGWAGSFLSGLLATAVATPCTAPFMGSALGYALTLPAPAALGVFTALGLGMAAPYVVLSAVPGLLQRLPKPGRWMETLKQLMGFPMMAAAVWMASVLAALSGTRALVFLLGAFAAAGAGAWAWGRWGGMDRSRGARIAAGVVAFALVASSAALAVRTSVTTLPLGGAGTAWTGGPASARHGDGWEAWSPERVQELRADGRPVFIDFSARWCLTCQVNERVALGTPQVQKAFRDKGVALLVADWTDRNEDIADALASYGRAGVPLYVLYAPRSFMPVILPEVLTPGIVLAALEKLPAR